MAVDGSQLGQLLQRLDAFFVEQGAPVADALRPGLGPAELDAAEAELGFSLPHEVRDWYAWHDGVEETDAGGVRLPNLTLLSSMRDALDARQTFLNPGPLVDAYQVYQPTWLPITQFEAETLVVDCAGAATGRQASAPVYVIDYADEWEQVMPSITAMVQLWITAIDEGYWRYDRDRGSWAHTFGQLPLEYRVSGVM